MRAVYRFAYPLILSMIAAASSSMPIHAAFARGDVAVMSEADAGSIEQGVVKVFDRDGMLRGSILASSRNFNPSGVAFDNALLLLVGDHDASPAPSATNVYGAVNQSLLMRLPIDATSYAFDRDGLIYVVPVSGERLSKHSNSGTRLATYSLPGRFPQAIDLGADQCTLFYTYEELDGTGRIGRYDACRAIALVDLPIALPPVQYHTRRGLRILHDGTLLVVVGDGSPSAPNGAWRISSGGAVLQTYAVTVSDRPWLGLALDPTGTAFWTVIQRGGTSETLNPRLLRVSIANGAVLADHQFISNYDVEAVTVAGEYRAALTAAPAIPAVSGPVYAALAVMLATIAIRRL